MTNSDSEAKSKTKPVQHYYEENDVDTYFADQKIKVPDDDSVCTFFNLFINLPLTVTYPTVKFGTSKFVSEIKKN